MDKPADPRLLDTRELRLRQHILGEKVKALLVQFEKDNPGVVVSGSNVKRVQYANSMPNSEIEEVWIGLSFEDEFGDLMRL